MCNYFGHLVNSANAKHEDVSFFVLKTSGLFVPVMWFAMIWSLTMDVSNGSEFPLSVSNGPSSLYSVQTVSEKFLASASGV